MSLTKKELAIVLAALREYQMENVDHVAPTFVGDREHFRELPAADQYLSRDEIDDLCKKLNRRVV